MPHVFGTGTAGGLSALKSLCVFGACFYFRVPSLRDSPTETSDFCGPELWRVRRSRLLLIRSSSLWGSGVSCRDSRSPSGFHIRNWKRTANPPAAAAAAGSDRKLLLELRKVQDTSWGCEHAKVTLPCESGERHANVRKGSDAGQDDGVGTASRLHQR